MYVNKNAEVIFKFVFTWNYSPLIWSISIRILKLSPNLCSLGLFISDSNYSCVKLGQRLSFWMIELRCAGKGLKLCEKEGWRKWILGWISLCRLYSNVNWNEGQNFFFLFEQQGQNLKVRRLFLLLFFLFIIILGFDLPLLDPNKQLRWWGVEIEHLAWVFSNISSFLFNGSWHGLYYGTVALITF